ncbi:NAD(P)/FAD-dependent oxidoreductase [Christensenellaceae bacterium OttesenSCG-928-K19]|nr:NAD(P)/FAD-dependent oxidoreductase [Christensenellaceae bacterium OttesenSCG-928-K19]
MGTWKLAQPLQVGNKLLKNRMVMAPMETRLSRPDGSSTAEMAAYYAERAKGGVAMIVVENTFVDANASRSSLVSSGLQSDHMIAGKFTLAEAIKKHNCVAVVQLSHGGRQANPGATGLACVAPSPIPCKVTQRMPHELTTAELLEIEDAFAAAAVRAKTAGFDGIEIHGAHGYLICSFLSPYTNKRTDEYGGDAEKRGRFPREVATKIREAVGDDFIVGYRISGSEFVDGGLTIADTSAFVKTIQDTIDYIHVSAGIYESMAEWQIPPLYIEQGKFAFLAEEMKKAVDIPVIAVGALDAQLGEELLQKGGADLIGFGRPLIADPDLPNKIISDTPDQIRPCFRGNTGCISLFFDGSPIRCEINPRCGRELEYKLSKTREPKTVVVAGGGMAGMEAARICSLMGHNVTLLEQSSELGGHFIEGTMPAFKKEAHGVLEWLRLQIKNSNVHVEMNTHATPELLKTYKPDAVFVAVGSKYATPPIDGIEEAASPYDMLMGTQDVGVHVVVIGGGLIGCETALHLAQQGKKVTIIEMLPTLVPNDDPISKQGLEIKLEEYGVNVLLNSTVSSVKDNMVSGKTAEGREFAIKGDPVVCATGLAPQREEADALMCCAPQVFRIGDCVSARKVYECFHEAWHAAMQLDD